MITGSQPELRYELLKVILSNPSTNIMEVNIDNVSVKLDQIIQVIWNKNPQEESQLKAKP